MDLIQSTELGANSWFGVSGPGYQASMSLALLLIVIGIVLAILVHYALGIVCILIGLVLLIWPRMSAGRGARV
jgi:succinate dehydrogenase/fumarate reductase cytochrome b subunit